MYSYWVDMINIIPIHYLMTASFYLPEHWPTNRGSNAFWESLRKNSRHLFFSGILNETSIFLVTGNRRCATEELVK